MEEGWVGQYRSKPEPKRDVQLDKTQSASVRDGKTRATQTDRRILAVALVVGRGGAGDTDHDALAGTGAALKGTVSAD